MSLANMKIGAKLATGFGAVIFFLVMSGLGTWIYSSDVTANYEIQNSNMRGTVELANVERGMWSLRFGIANYPGADESGRAKIIADEAKFYGDIKQALDAYGAMGNISVRESAAIGALKETISSYMGSRPKWFELFNEGKLDEAKVWRAANTNKYGAETVKELQDLIALKQTMNEAAQAAIGENTNKVRVTILTFVIVAVLIAMTLGLLITRSITRPLQEAVEVADAVAKGDLTRSIEVKSKDEAGQLLQALKDMNQHLSGIVGEVRNTTDNISTASQEISQGNADLSQRTEHQAASLEETATSMEELTSTVKQNAENAKLANQLAASASDIAVQGGRAVGEVVDTMASISDSSRKIIDIISVIEGIAFQTNILALNAAVEAARAGEQGRGFAVVAGEVRNLAQRSAAAAKEIKMLIDDSVSKVDNGSRQVDQAGITMNEIVAAVKRVTDIMSEIAAASNEQSVGIGQVNLAISQMDEMTQQNAALVEEAAAAAESMQEQASILIEAVSLFKIVGGREIAQKLSAKLTAMPAARISAPLPDSAVQYRKNRQLSDRTGVGMVRESKDGDWKEF